ncbi:MAG: FAD-binding oxidoreductase [Actinobacteria bacterium]|nr:FAD-binding oxidoreductase [Actinomycetota bacterium]
MSASPAVPLPESAEVVVIGGGVMGASVAFHLAEAGITDVLLLERDQLGSGSTSKAAGGVRAQFSDPVNIALGARSLAAFEAFPEHPGQVIDLRQVGYLFLLTDAADVTVYEASVALQNEMGVDSRMLTPAQAAALSPGVVTDDVLAASFHPRDGYCSPESVVLGYATGARRLGARIRTGVEVTGVTVTGGDIESVSTTSGTVRTTAVVCAAGPWSAAIGDMAGVHLPVAPLRRQILITEALGPDLVRMLPESMPMTIDAASTFYLHREGPALLLGMSYRGEQPGFHLDYSEEWLPELMAAIDLRCPVLLDVGIAHRWSGLYEDTPDHNALIGEAPDVSRFLYATGFSGHGFLQGPAVGEVLRDLYLRREPVVDVTPLTAQRFVAGALRGEVNIV